MQLLGSLALVFLALNFVLSLLIDAREGWANGLSARERGVYLGVRVLYGLALLILVLKEML